MRLEPLAEVVLALLIIQPAPDQDLGALAVLLPQAVAAPACLKGGDDRPGDRSRPHTEVLPGREALRRLQHRRPLANAGGVAEVEIGDARVARRALERDIGSGDGCGILPSKEHISLVSV